MNEELLRESPLRASDYSVCRARMALGPDHLVGGRTGYRLHGGRKDQDCKHHPTVPDDRDLGRHGDCICRGLPDIARSIVS